MESPQELLPFLNYDSEEATMEEMADYYYRCRLFWNHLNDCASDEHKLVPLNGAAEPSDEEVAGLVVSVFLALSSVYYFFQDTMKQPHHRKLLWVATGGFTWPEYPDDDAVFRAEEAAGLLYDTHVQDNNDEDDSDDDIQPPGLSHATLFFLTLVSFSDGTSPPPEDPRIMNESLPSIISDETINPDPNFNMVSSDDEQNDNDFEPADYNSNEFDEVNPNPYENPVKEEASEVVDVRMQNEPTPAINALVCYL